MQCLANFCYVCLEKKDKLLSNINSSLSMNKDIIHIIGSLPYNLVWLKNLQIILICEECCLRLRENYQFQEKCLKNSALLQTYMNKLNTTSISNTGNVAEFLVKLNVTHKDINEVKCEIESEDEDYTIQWQQNIAEIGDVFVDFEDSLIKEGIICKKVDDKSDNNSTEITEETEDVFVNAEEYFVKEENTWKREKVDDGEKYPTDNNSTENMDQESDSETALSDNAHLTNTNGVNSEFTCKHAHTTNKNDLKTAAKKSFRCSTCSKYFVTKSALTIHTRIHRNEKLYECAICKKRFGQKVGLVIHMRIHTGEKPYSCTTCKKSFAHHQSLIRHMKVHTGEKPYCCTTCKKSFAQHQYLVSHMRAHTGEKPYSCTTCKKSFAHHPNLITHMKVHTGEKPYSCTTCKKCFTQHQHLVSHMKVHTGEKPYTCTTCKKSFAHHQNLITHMRVHTGEKPYSCPKCKKCFARNSSLVRHMRTHTDKKSQE